MHTIPPRRQSRSPRWTARVCIVSIGAGLVCGHPSAALATDPDQVQVQFVGEPGKHLRVEVLMLAHGCTVTMTVAVLDASGASLGIESASGEQPFGAMAQAEPACREAMITSFNGAAYPAIEALAAADISDPAPPR